MTLPTFAPPYPPSINESQPEIKILKAEFGDGYTQEGGDGMNNVRDVVRLKWNTLTAVQADEIESFLKARRGYERFWYQLSDSPAPVKWACPEWSRSRGTPNAISATFNQKFDIT
jgi:phage-related protein